MRWHVVFREGARLVVAVALSLALTGRVCVDLAGATAAAVVEAARYGSSSRPPAPPSPALPEWLRSLL